MFNRRSTVSHGDPDRSDRKKRNGTLAEWNGQDVETQSDTVRKGADGVKENECGDAKSVREWTITALEIEAA